MKKILALVLALCMVFALAACGEAASDPTDAPESEAPEGDGTFTTIVEGKLTMSTNAQFPPYEMTTDDGGFEGIDVEIATAIAEKLGLELDILDMDFDSALLAVQQGKSDIVMAGVTVTEERAAVMEFSDSYATGVQVVIVKEGSDVTMDNLGEKMIGCQKATTGYIYASDTPENGGYGEDHVIAYETGALAVEALKNGQVDCVIIDNEPAKAYVAANEGLTILDGEWVTEDYAIGMKQGNTALLEAVNNAMAELKADGTFQTIVDKYITTK